MTELDARSVPADETSRAALAAGGLQYRLADPGSEAEIGNVFRAILRGFTVAEPNDEVLQTGIGNLSMSRLVGVYDAASAQPDLPVGTAECWVTPLTIPGGELPMWAITGVTVAATHRRRGIATALVEGELRAAAAAGLPFAGLTVSEPTIYARYGFGPATWQSHWTVDARRAGWIGPDPAGSVQFLDPEALAAALAEVHERSRSSRIGELGGIGRRWRQLAGAGPEETNDRASVRGVGYFDPDGALRGAMAYRVAASDDDWTRQRLEIRHLVGETADARAALWRYALQHDLVGTVTAHTRPVDDPLPWMIADTEAAKATTQDKGWLRILDLPRALAARSYRAPLSVVLRVKDRLGFAEGTWRVEADGSGFCGVAPAPGAEPDIVLGVSELSSLYLGGASASALAEAGRLHGDATAIAQLELALRTERAPHLSFSY